MWPEVGIKRPMTDFRTVDLPAPLGPMMTTISSLLQINGDAVQDFHLSV